MYKIKVWRKTLGSLLGPLSVTVSHVTIRTQKVESTDSDNILNSVPTASYHCKNSSTVVDFWVVHLICMHLSFQKSIVYITRCHPYPKEHMKTMLHSVSSGTGFAPWADIVLWIRLSISLQLDALIKFTAALTATCSCASVSFLSHSLIRYWNRWCYEQQRGALII